MPTCSSNSFESTLTHLDESANTDDCSDMSDKTRMTTVWQNFLQSANSKKRCLACDRGIHDNEAAAIEKYVRCSCDSVES